MKFSTGHKILLFLVLTITAVVLCTLPLLFVKKNTLYIYTNKVTLNSQQQTFIKGLKQVGFDVIVNKQGTPKKQSDALWLFTKKISDKIQNNQFRFNFIYTEDNYPLDWQQLKTPIIVLTPHQALYEHYMRSNVPTAKIDINTAKTSAQRFYEIWKWLNENRQTNFVD